MRIYMVKSVCLKVPWREALSTSEHVADANGDCFGHETMLVGFCDMMLL